LVGREVDSLIISGGVECGTGATSSGIGQLLDRQTRQQVPMTRERRAMCAQPATFGGRHGLAAQGVLTCQTGALEFRFDLPEGLERRPKLLAGRRQLLGQTDEETQPGLDVLQFHLGSEPGPIYVRICCYNPWKRLCQANLEVILNKRVNIAAAFEEAAAEDAILFFDEGDSFLRSRARAHHGWEVTQTNEFLQKMERFDGIVIVATNLFRDLDAAALRRFTFKIEFRELDLTQRWKMFLAETGLADGAVAIDPDTREQWEQRLLFMKYLTPGDFATVKRQCRVLDTTLTPEEWLQQLEIECQIKSTGLDCAGERAQAG
jgi:ATPase family associated with various cellular activities (AAA)